MYNWKNGKMEGQVGEEAQAVADPPPPQKKKRNVIMKNLEVSSLVESVGWAKESDFPFEEVVLVQLK
jgi:hypothetical protein